MALFTDAELSAYLRYEVSADAAAIAERVVSGKLKAAMGVTGEWPETVSDQVFSWALELGALAHENPGLLSSQTIGDETNQWQRDAVKSILDAAAADGSGGASNPNGPRGCFPPAQPWPDPAQQPYGRVYYR